MIDEPNPVNGISPTLLENLFSYKFTSSKVLWKSSHAAQYESFKDNPLQISIIPFRMIKPRGIIIFLAFLFYKHLL